MRINIEWVLMLFITVIACVMMGIVYGDPLNITETTNTETALSFKMISKTGYLYSVKNKEESITSLIQIMKWRSLTLNGGWAEQRGVLAVMIDLSDLTSRIPVADRTINTINTLPLIKLEVGGYGAYNFNCEEFDYGFIASIIELSF